LLVFALDRHAEGIWALDGEERAILDAALAHVSGDSRRGRRRDADSA
jgi:hypothetical protein